jgi:hypothetical protein
VTIFIKLAINALGPINGPGHMSDGPFMGPRAFMASFMKMVMC